MESIGASDARERFSDVMRMAQTNPVVVSRRGQDQAVVVSMEQYTHMKLAVEELEDVAAFDQAMAEQEESLSWEQAKADLGWT